MTAEERDELIDRRIRRLAYTVFGLCVVVVLGFGVIGYLKITEEETRSRDEYRIRLANCVELEKSQDILVDLLDESLNGDSTSRPLLNRLIASYDTRIVGCVNGARAVVGKPPIEIPPED